MPLPPLDIAGLPLVLAGPIVRRVDAGTTTIWIALKAAQKVTLEVWAGELPSGDPTEKRQEGTAVTSQIGKHVHLLAITAKGSALAPGTIYRYTLRFGDPASAPTTPVGVTGKGLFDPGVVAATADAARKTLLYTETAGAPKLPSFATPPATAGGVRIMHGSCRKPHGEGRDALSILDEILKTDVGDAARRPHQLLLTGDQIYADDVADVLLHACMTRGAELLGRTEVLPGLANQAQRMRPGHRQTAMLELFRLTSEKTKSHLVTFAEFACMYLMAWSNVLWPPRPLDLFADIYPDEAKRLGQPTGEMLFGLIVQKSYTHAVETLNEFVTECDFLERYVDALPGVRRALANTSTYMIFDDHEVTDDWYITEQWMLEVTGSPLGLRLLINALAAYAVFQEWGNVPDRFGPGSPGEAGRAILATLATPDPTDAAGTTVLKQRLGIPTAVTQGVPQRPAGAMDWHYAITWNSHQLVVLDTRTRRRFTRGAQAPPALVFGDDDYTAMLPAAEAPQVVTIVVSPAPVVGFPLIERILQPLLTTDYHGLLAKDGEAWGMHTAAFEKLIARLMTMPDPDPADGVRRHRVVLLSGDVHYGFTTRLNYTATKPFHSPAGAAEGIVAQFVASSLKNQEAGFPKTEFVHQFDLATSTIERHEDRAGWSNQGGAPLKVGGRVVSLLQTPVWTEYWPGGEPVVVAAAPELVITRTPEWRYTIDLIPQRDADAAAPRPGTPAPVGFPADNRAEAIAQYVAAASNHDNYHGFWGRGKGVVGFNNLGEVRVTSPPTGDKSVVHTLWWRIGSEPTAAPLTRMVVPLTITPVDAPLYGAIDLREGDKDAATASPIYAGVSRSDLIGRDYVQALQRDLRELGILMDRADDGVFSRYTRWAVRELQGYAKMATVAREIPPTETALTAPITAGDTVVPLAAPLPSGSLARIRIENEILNVTGGAGTKTLTVIRGQQGTIAAAHKVGHAVACLDLWSARLQSAPNWVRYDGPVSGVVNARTRAVIAQWKRDRLRCPVVIEAWDIRDDGVTRDKIHGHTVAGAETPAENVWRPDDVGPATLHNVMAPYYSTPNVFVRDFSDFWNVLPDASLKLLGTCHDYVDRGTTLAGPYADPLYRHTSSAAEILPESLTGVPLAQLRGAALSTFKIIRAVGEVEAVGYFDGVNGYDEAFASLGLCHWTAGSRIADTKKPRDQWEVNPGELWAFWAYLRTFAPADYTRMVGHFGLQPDRQWLADGARGTPPLWVPEQRKYAAYGTETDEAGRPQRMSGRLPTYGPCGEHDYLRGWHWFHRFMTACRTSPGLWRAMWNMARMRLRDIVDANWNNPDVPAASRFPLPAGTRVGDVFRSERTIALLYRWHIYSPANVFFNGAASMQLHAVLTTANTAGPAFSQDLSAWTSAHEQALARAILDVNPCTDNHPADHRWHDDARNPGHTLRVVDAWPTWSATRNPRHFTLDLSVLTAAERQLTLTRRPLIGPFEPLLDLNGLP